MLLVYLQAEASYSACLTHQDKHGAARLTLARLALANGQVCNSGGLNPADGSRQCIMLYVMQTAYLITVLPNLHSGGSAVWPRKNQSART